MPRTIDASTGVDTIQPNKRLTAERLAKLESIGFAWSAKHIRKKKSEGGVVLASAPVAEQPQLRRQKLNEAQWEDMYQRLVQFQHQHGHTLVPRKFEADPKLATWVETQRVLWNRDYRNMNQNLSTGTKVNVASTSETTVDTFKSDSFVAAADEDSKKRLTPERKHKLDQLGFVWSLRNKRIEDHWDEMFQQLLEYKNLHGDCLVPSRFEPNLKLGKVREFACGLPKKLSLSCRLEFAQSGGLFCCCTLQWVETQRYEYTKLQRAARVNGTTVSEVSANDVSSEESEDAKHFQTTTTARVTTPRLTEDRQRRLESIGFEWKVKHKMKRYYDKQWDQMFGRLLAFKDTNGHCLVPKRYPPDMKLGTWVHTQRIQYRKLMAGVKKVTFTEEEVSQLRHAEEEAVTYRLTDERRKRLEEVGFVWSVRAGEGEKGFEGAAGGAGARITRNSYDDQWDSMFEQLKAYKAKFGSCLVPKRYKENPKLGTWVDTQRVQYKKLKKKLALQGKDAEEASTASGNDEDEPGIVEVLTVENGTPAIADTKTAKPAAAASGTLTMSPKPLVGRLTDERIRRLHNLGFVWSLRDDWQKHYDELKGKLS